MSTAFAPAVDMRSFADLLPPRVHVGDGWLHFQAHASLFGIVFFGAPSAASCEALVPSLRLELLPDAAPHRSLVDASRLRSADAGAFEVLHRYVTAHKDALSAAVTKLALVRPAGLAGAVTAGFYEVLESPYPVEVFDDAAAALAWLGEGAALATALEQVAADVTGTSTRLARLRAVLAADLGGATPAAAAAALGMSDRTLQRRLKEEGTTFAAELKAARLREAKRRMRETDAALSAIALDAGFSSQAHFSRAFKDDTGRSPSAWRKGGPSR